jgi:hypothetical protein
MPRADPRAGQPGSIRCAGQKRPGNLPRFYAQSLSSGCSSTLIAHAEKPPRLTRGLVPISNGASSVASALGFRSGATPRGCTHSNRCLRFRLSKPDISILLGTGHSYFALTEKVTSDREDCDYMQRKHKPPMQGRCAIMSSTWRSVHRAAANFAAGHARPVDLSRTPPRR